MFKYAAIHQLFNDNGDIPLAFKSSVRILLRSTPAAIRDLGHTQSQLKDPFPRLTTGFERQICLFVGWLVFSHTSNFSAIWRLSPLPVTRLKILAYARRSGPLSREGS
jgi:hypothetical protein